MKSQTNEAIHIKPIDEYITELVESLEDVNWCIKSVVEFKRVREDDEFYAELEDGSRFEEQDNYYIQQIQHGDDWFSGTIIYPITENKAVLIHYDC